MTDLRTEVVIAVVDDDQRVLESLGALLESADYTVRLFQSAAAMLESGCLPGITCLISDIDMPVMDGFELLQIVQAQRRGLLVILITGQSGKFNQSPPSDLGAYRLLKKPFNARNLLALISDSLPGSNTNSPQAP